MPADLVTFTEEILTEEILHFLCSTGYSHCSYSYFVTAISNINQPAPLMFFISLLNLRSALSKTVTILGSGNTLFCDPNGDFPLIPLKIIPK